jgi:aminotransferase in exopolysaccharide biosynthesis
MDIKIPLSTPCLTGKELDYIKECLDSGWVSSTGPFVKRFEDAFAHYVGAQYAVAACNGTAALHLALLAGGVQPGDEVLVPTITFAATINVVHYCNAVPVFFDCDQDFNLDLDGVERFISEKCRTVGGRLFNTLTGRPIWGIIPVHVFGNPVDMTRLMALARVHGLTVVEDAAEALGSSHANQHAGTVGTFGCFSFNGNKIITTGGGGMVVTDSCEMATKIRYLSTQAKDDGLRFIHNEVGYNYRLTSIQAAMGTAQLEALPEFLVRKKAIHRRYVEGFADISDVQVRTPASEGISNHWITNISLRSNCSRDALGLITKLTESGIEARPLWYPNHLQRPNKDFPSFEISRALGEVSQTVSLPSSVHLQDADQTYVIQEVIRILGAP